MTEWYVIDRRTNAIVNCITADRLPTKVLELMVDAEFLVLDPCPPRHMLESYRYWNERP